MRVALLTVVAALLVGGCKLEQPTCAFACAFEGDRHCPSGYECRADSRCHKLGSGPTCGAPDDGPPGDGPLEAGPGDGPYPDVPPGDGGVPDAALDGVPQTDALAHCDGPRPTCSLSNMALVPTTCTTYVCVDQFEAYLEDGGVAVSASGSIPVNYINATDAANACLAASKRLCTDAEWLAACQGAGSAPRVFPYGDTYQPHACSGLDHRDAGVVGLLQPTGSLTDCKTPEWVFDLSGNVAEITAESASTTYVRGGSASLSQADLTCLAVAVGSSGAQEVGFRCCRDPE
jgi:hypothetical protein